MLLESLTFVNVWLVLEREQLESLRSDSEDILKEHLTNFLEPQIDDFCPRFLSQLDGLRHAILSFVLDIFEDILHFSIIDWLLFIIEVVSIVLHWLWLFTLYLEFLLLIIVLDNGGNLGSVSIFIISRS